MLSKYACLYIIGRNSTKARSLSSCRKLRIHSNVLDVTYVIPIHDVRNFTARNHEHYYMRQVAAEFWKGNFISKLCLRRWIPGKPLKYNVPTGKRCFEENSQVLEAFVNRDAPIGR